VFCYGFGMIYCFQCVCICFECDSSVKSRYDTLKSHSNHTQITLKSVCLLVISPKIERDGSFFDRLIGAMTFEILQMVLKVAVGDSV